MRARVDTSAEWRERAARRAWRAIAPPRVSKSSGCQRRRRKAIERFDAQLARQLDEIVRELDRALEGLA